MSIGELLNELGFYWGKGRLEMGQIWDQVDAFITIQELQGILQQIPFIPYSPRLFPPLHY
jgi:hypothetical protein